MKKSILTLLIAFFAISLTIFTLSSFDDNAEYFKKSSLLSLSPDTLSTSTSLDTATCYLQLNADSEGSDWYNLQSIVVDGVTTRDFKTGSILRGTLRCQCLAPSSTQSTAVRVDLAVTSQ